MKKKTFMLIGASRPNVPIITMARSIGYEVVVTDINPEAEGLKHGDYNYNVSAKDVEMLCKLAIRHGVDCVYSGTDINFSVGAINETLGIKGFPLLLGLASEYKNIFRPLAEGAGMPLTRAYLVETEQEALNAYAELGKGKAVVKAVNLSSSLGVRMAASDEEVVMAFRDCAALSAEKEFIIEEYVKGVCHDVNGLVIEGSFYPCGVVDRSFVEDGSHFVQKQATCPTSASKELQLEMYSIMARFCKHLNIHTAPVKADFLCGGDRAYLLEFAPRFHGEMGFLHVIPGAISIRAMEAYLGYRYSGVFDESLIEEKVIDSAVCRADIRGTEKSNYDIDRYVISFIQKDPIEVYIR